MKKSGTPPLPPLLPSSSKPHNPTTTTDPDALHNDLLPRRRPLRRRRIRNVAFLAGKKGALTVDGGRRSGPTTPLLRWKFDDADVGEDPAVPEGDGRKSRWKQRNVVSMAAQVSSRRLAAGIWQLQLPEVAAGSMSGKVGTEPVHGHLQAPHLCNLKSADHHKDSKDCFSSSPRVSNPKNGAFYQPETSTALANPAMERATKWDPGLSKASDEVYRFYGHLKLLEDQQVTTISVVSALQTELELARSRINELEDERRSSKKKLDHFLRKLAEEKASWHRREHEKIRAVVDDIKDDLNREKKNRQRMEILNSKLVNDLKEAKLSVKRYLQDYEKERKSRELMEEVCDELAKEIGEDKAKVEALKRESMKIREEVEEERKMLQMAEVWREERVQMKLIDAKLTLEEKYMQLTKLQADLEAFLKAHSGSVPNVADIQEAELLTEAVNSVKVHDIKEFSYQPPPASEDIFSVFEELQPADETNKREVESCNNFSPNDRASKIHTVSTEINGFIGSPMKMYEHGVIYRNGDAENDSGWETVSHGEEQGSSNSLDGSDPSVNGVCLESNASVSGTDWEETTENGKLNSETIGVCSATSKQSRKKTSSIARLWKSSCPNNNENYKIVSVEATNGRLSNGLVSNETLSPDRGSVDGGLSPPSLGQWSSPDLLNPDINRGIKGCIEWPRGTQKQSLKAKLLEARMETQKIQLRQVLKQKI